MGNKISSDENYGQVIIVTQKKKYIAGEQVNGYINISLLTTFPSSELFMLIEGKEKTKTVHSRQVTDSEGHSQTEHYSRKDSNVFYEHSFPIYSQNDGHFPPGQYSFPFSFVLGEHLPGTFVHKWKDAGYKPYGKIKYKIKAGLKDINSSTSVYDKFHLIVDEKMTKGSSNLMPEPFDTKVSGYCYTSHGNYKLAAIFTNDRYLVGDKAVISIAIDATSGKTDVKFVSCELIMTTTVTAQGWNNSHNVVMQTQEFAGIPKGTSKMGPDSIPVSMDITTNGEFQATASGTLVKNVFWLKITGKIDGCVCCSKHPQTSIPICIYNKHFGAQSLPVMNQVIPNWAPQTFDPYVCQMNSEYKMSSAFRNGIYGTQAIQMNVQ